MPSASLGSLHLQLCVQQAFCLFNFPPTMRMCLQEHAEADAAGEARPGE